MVRIVSTSSSIALPSSSSTTSSSTTSGSTTSSPPGASAKAHFIFVVAPVSHRCARPTVILHWWHHTGVSTRYGVHLTKHGIGHLLMRHHVLGITRYRSRRHAHLRIVILRMHTIWDRLLWHARMLLWWLRLLLRLPSRLVCRLSFQCPAASFTIVRCSAFIFGCCCSTSFSNR